MLSIASRGGVAAAGLLVLALCSFAAAASDIENYRLTEAGLDRYERATEAMYRFAVENPELAQALRDEDEEESESDADMNGDAKFMAQRLDEQAPGLRAAMEKSGMKLEEYFTFSIALAANALGAAFADQFGGADDSSLTDLQRANLQFVRKHMQRFEAFGARMQEKYPSLAEDEDEYGEEDYGDEEFSEEFPEEYEGQ